MPRMSASKEELSGGPPIPDGLYHVVLKGFNPVKSKNGDSVNLNPDIRIINHPTLNDRKVFVSMNTNAPFMWAEITHCFGVPLAENGDSVDIPGSFDGPEDISGIAPKGKVPWTYSGPLLNQQGQLQIGQKEYQGKLSADVKQYICRVAGCAVKHSDNLIK
jgi:hypothetical protein